MKNWKEGVAFYDQHGRLLCAECYIDAGLDGTGLTDDEIFMDSEEADEAGNFGVDHPCGNEYHLCEICERNIFDCTWDSAGEIIHERAKGSLPMPTIIKLATFAHTCWREQMDMRSWLLPKAAVKGIIPADLAKRQLSKEDESRVIRLLVWYLQE